MRRLFAPCINDGRSWLQLLRFQGNAFHYRKIDRNEAPFIIINVAYVAT